MKELKMTVQNGFIYPIQPLVDAISEFDKSKEFRNKNWELADSEKDVLLAEKSDADALRKVQEAFWELTKDRNSKDDCYKADIEFMRKIANDFS